MAAWADLPEVRNNRANDVDARQVPPGRPLPVQRLPRALHRSRSARCTSAARSAAQVARRDAPDDGEQEGHERPSDHPHDRRRYKTSLVPLPSHPREPARDNTRRLQGGEGMIVDVDERFVVGLEKNKHRSKRKHQGTGAVSKEAVVSLVERGGRVRSHHIPEVNAKTLGPLLEAQLNGSGYVYTDEGGAMRKAAKQFDRHDPVNHSIGEYVHGHGSHQCHRRIFFDHETRHPWRVPPR